mmetsp:Transcript_21934/g.61066  ORF Transcript_21934/g.61066 Transcript_21934/m.61066 type:complete len:341 (+) Transcript_21934:452-1474(+)
MAALWHDGVVGPHEEAVVGGPDLHHGDLALVRAHGGVGEGGLRRDVRVGVADFIAGDLLIEEDVHEGQLLGPLLLDAERHAGGVLFDDDDGEVSAGPGGVADLHQQLDVLWALVRSWRHGGCPGLGVWCHGIWCGRLALLWNWECRWVWELADWVELVVVELAADEVVHDVRGDEHASGLSRHGHAEASLGDDDGSAELAVGNLVVTQLDVSCVVEVPHDAGGGLRREVESAVAEWVDEVGQVADLGKAGGWVGRDVDEDGLAGEGGIELDVHTVREVAQVLLVDVEDLDAGVVLASLEQDGVVVWSLGVREEDPIWREAGPVLGLEEDVLHDLDVRCHV